MHVRWIVWLAALVAAMCFGSAHAQTCVSDEDCQDGAWCNGVERCVGNPVQALCLPAPRPMCSARQRCDEAAMRCIALDKTEAHTCPEGQAYSVADGKCVAVPAE